MYNYEWDKESGGYILNTLVKFVEKELRPVFFEELDLLGFNDYYTYDKCEDPIMWAETRRYIYKGEYIAEARGGSLYTKPQLILTEKGEELKGQRLEKVNLKLFIQKNEAQLQTLEQLAADQIYWYYKKYEDKVNSFRVAFSGGKDSIVLLDIINKILPESRFFVTFADTTMECEDTYNAVDFAKLKYKNLKFYTAKSSVDSLKTWSTFGPPSNSLRWCCTVHKSTPQFLLMKSMIEYSNRKSIVFTGVRSDESTRRSTYSFEQDGGKHFSELSIHPLLKWATSEIFLYILSNELLYNKAYRYGISRVGCMICPLASGINDYINNYRYPKQVDKYIDIIKKSSNKKFIDELDANRFVEIGGWKLRKSGREITFGKDLCIERETNSKFEISVLNVSSSWRQWIKALGNIDQLDKFNWKICYKKSTFVFFINESEDTIEFKMPLMQNEQKTEIDFKSQMRKLFRKVAYCGKCKACQAECITSALKIDKEIEIDDKCVKCGKCYDIDYGCLLANSLRVGGNSMKMKGIMRYGRFGFRQEWLDKYFEKRDELWKSTDLGVKMIPACKKFLQDCAILDGLNNGELYPIFNKIGSSSIFMWEIMYVNLASSPMIRWYVFNVEQNIEYSVANLNQLLPDEMPEASKLDIVSSLRNIYAKTPLGNILRQGQRDENTKIIVKGSYMPNPLVILYAMYKFAEKTDGGWYSFSFTNLVNDSEDREAISPMKIFGMNEVELKQILQGLDLDYPEYISVAFKKGLENIDLKKGKTSKDILELILSEVK